jgi:hypothetical protein
VLIFPSQRIQLVAAMPAKRLSRDRAADAAVSCGLPQTKYLI